MNVQGQLKETESIDTDIFIYLAGMAVYLEEQKQQQQSCILCYHLCIEKTAGYFAHRFFSCGCYLFTLKEDVCTMCLDLKVLAALVVLMGDLLFECGDSKGWQPRLSIFLLEISRPHDRVRATQPTRTGQLLGTGFDVQYNYKGKVGMTVFFLSGVVIYPCVQCVQGVSPRIVQY